MSVAIHAGKARDVFWAVGPKRVTTVRLRLSRQLLRRGRAVVVATVDDRSGHTSVVRRTVRLAKHR